MKRLVLILTCALLSSAMFYSCKPSDEKLQKQVETVLSAAQSSVTGTVKDGVVTLNGTVDSDEAKAAAEVAVKAIKDIKSVTNNIEVKLPVVINPDEVLTTAITTALTAAGFKDVKLTVSEGVVTLTGDAKKADLQKIMEIANSAQPKKVLNQLKLK
ncbi:BON domain-containing protein [Dysgonomonas sp. 521]|uniref:BON domain-containing protein n=1 Tax=Dysgonomonas sp. 521 TaxID=2302932 RepID=UPI0013D42339|nr:BON domain-containing protein [Dysgonomonas sp. 521]NDV95632.1 BON domain-containing protein [Dysgonomonas sp. 521]